MIEDTQTVNSTDGDAGELARVRRLFGTYLALILLLPTIAIAALLFVMWDLSRDVDEVRVLEEISRIDRSFSKMTNYALAISAFRDLAHESGHRRAYARWAAAAAGAGKFDEARQAYEEAARADLVSPEIHGALCFVELSTGNHSLSVEFGEKALAENPFDVESLNNLAWIYATTEDDSLKDLETAARYAEAAVEYTLAKNKSVLDTLETVYSKSLTASELRERASSKFDDVVETRVLAYFNQGS